MNTFEKKRKRIKNEKMMRIKKDEKMRTRTKESMRWRNDLCKNKKQKIKKNYPADNL